MDLLATFFVSITMLCICLGFVFREEKYCAAFYIAAFLSFVIALYANTYVLFTGPTLNSCEQCGIEIGYSDYCPLCGSDISANSDNTN